MSLLFTVSGGPVLYDKLNKYFFRYLLGNTGQRVAFLLFLICFFKGTNYVIKKLDEMFPGKYPDCMGDL